MHSFYFRVVAYGPCWVSPENDPEVLGPLAFSLQRTSLNHCPKSTMLQNQRGKIDVS